MATASPGPAKRRHRCCRLIKTHHHPELCVCRLEFLSSLGPHRKKLPQKAKRDRCRRLAKGRFSRGPSDFFATIFNRLRTVSGREAEIGSDLRRWPPRVKNRKTQRGQQRSAKIAPYYYNGAERNENITSSSNRAQQQQEQSTSSRRRARMTESFVRPKSTHIDRYT